MNDMATVETLAQDKEDAEKDLKKYKKRLKEIKQIRSDLSSVDEDYRDDINKKLDSALSNLINGIGSDRQEYRTAISSLKQSGISGDTNLSECKSYLDQEVTRINNKIEATSQDIQDLSSRIDDAESNS